MDIIFGTLATDDLKLIHHRTRRYGLQHGSQMSPRDPEPGEIVTISAATGTDLPVSHVACYYTTDGSYPKGERGIAQNGDVVFLKPVSTDWDTLTWSYSSIWQAEIPAQNNNTVVRYKIGAWSNDTDEVFADCPDPQITAEKAADAYFNDHELPSDFAYRDRDGKLFSYHVDRLKAPDWAYDAIIYHVFVDRFYAGDGHTWIQTDDLNGICGGTLWGVAQKLDYLVDLGINCIWLSPIWVSPSHHGYDVIDYDQVNPNIGGNEALHHVVEAAHKRGIRVLLDLVCNHISDDHPVFIEAKSDPYSPYRDWFTFDDSKIGYQAFFGVSSMPQVNLVNPAARDWMIDIARRWLTEYYVDGYRLDYANGPSPSFWGEFRAACKDANPDSFFFGEVIDAPDVQRTYINGLDGCLDFHLGAALRNTYAWGTWSEAQLKQFQKQQTDFFPPEFVMPTFVDSHDMDRFLFSANGDKNALRQAVAAQMQLPGPPIIYYGTEVGLSQPISTRGGAGLHVSRTPMLWGDDQDKDLFAFYQSVIKQRLERAMSRQIP